MSSVRDILNLKSLSKLIKLDTSKLNNAIGTYGIRAQGRFWGEEEDGGPSHGQQEASAEDELSRREGAGQSQSSGSPQGSIGVQKVVRQREAHERRLKYQRMTELKWGQESRGTFQEEM